MITSDILHATKLMTAFIKINQFYGRFRLVIFRPCSHLNIILSLSNFYGFTRIVCRK